MPHDLTTFLLALRLDAALRRWGRFANRPGRHGSFSSCGGLSNRTGHFTHPYQDLSKPLNFTTFSDYRFPLDFPGNTPKISLKVANTGEFPTLRLYEQNPCG